MDWKNCRITTNIVFTVLFLLSTVQCLYAQNGSGEPSGEVDEEISAVLSYEAQLGAIWTRYEEAKAANDENAMDRAHEEFKRIRRATSAEIFETAAYLFLDEGYKEFSVGNYDTARKEFAKAAELNPYLWPAYKGLGEIKREQGSTTNTPYSA